MRKKVSVTISSILSALHRTRSDEFSAFLGFDACIDNIVRVVREKDGINKTVYFTDSRKFGEYLMSMADKSCGIELETRISKAGGNMVITANALGNLGVKVDCMGTFGLPDILPFFRSVSPNCTLHTVAETITATALEFDNNKVILFDPGPYKELNWTTIKSVIGTEQIKELISGKQLISFLNWSEIENSSGIWLGILEEILPLVMGSSDKRIFFTDLSDCSRKTRNEIRYVFEILAKFRHYFKVILSLNHNEAELVAAALDVSYKVMGDKFIRDLYELTNADILVIHRIDNAVAYDGKEVEKCETFLFSNPAVLTGGGDNFNAGFCFGQLMGSDLLCSTIIANAVAGYYVKTGISPSVEDLINFFQEL